MSPALQTPLVLAPSAPAVHVPVSRATGATPTVPSPACEPEPVLDAEKLAVYRVSLELQSLASGLVATQQRVLRDQLERASLSVVLNIAEGAGRRSRKDKRRFYTIARGSACECAAAIDVLRHRHLAPEGSCATARGLALRVVQMLTKLDRALA